MNAPKIRIAHIITRMIVGGAQENTLHTCRALGQNPQYEVTLITGPGLGPEGNLLLTLSPKENFRLILLPQLRREIHLWHDLISFFQIWRHLLRGRFHIAHTHSSKAGILGRWAAWLARVPVRLHTVHGWGFHDYQSAWRRAFYIFLERWTSRITTRIIAVSRECITKGLAAQIGVPELYRVIYSGINLEKTQKNEETSSLRETLKIPAGKTILGTIGRLTPQKDPLFFVMLADQLVQKRNDLFFLVVGDGPLRGKVEAEIQKRLLQDCFSLIGLQMEVEPFLRLMDILVMPSRWEGLPRTLLEAMAMGKPVLVSEVDGVKEVLQDGVNGRMVASKESAAWCQAALELIEQPALRAKLGENAQKTVTHLWSDVKMVRDLEKLYQECLK